MLIFIILFLLFYLNPVIVKISNNENYNYYSFNKIEENIFVIDDNVNKINFFPDNLNQSILVKEIQGETLFSLNVNTKRDIASLTKLMSSYIAYNLYPGDEKFVFTKEALDQEGSVGNFYVGEILTRDDLLKASLVSSSNDAIYLLAQKYGLDKFVFLMEEKAKEWNMYNTKFVDPTGLGRNISNTIDLYLMTSKIFSQTPEIFEFTRLRKIIINGKILWTTNVLLEKYNSIIVGAKTGYKDSSGENLIAILKLNNSPFVIVVILNSNDRWREMEKIIKSLEIYYGK